MGEQHPMRAAMGEYGLCVLISSNKGLGEKQGVRGPCCLLALIPQANCVRLCTLMYPEGLFSLLERCRAMSCLLARRQGRNAAASRTL